MKIGDRIRDIEDGDCYYEGIVCEITNDDIFYKVDKIFWDGGFDLNSEILNTVISLKWWICEVYENGNWIEIK